MTRERNCGLKITDVKAVNYSGRRNFGPGRFLVSGVEVNFSCDNCLLVKDVKKTLQLSYVAESLSEAEQSIKKSSDMQELVALRSKVIFEQCPAYKRFKRRSS